MSTETLERLLARWRAGEEPEVPDDAVALTIEEALRYRDAGNIPDEQGRSLRLVLHTSDDEVARLATRRLEFERDFHDAPTWRRPGSKPVNVVPLRRRATVVASGSTVVASGSTVVASGSTEVAPGSPWWEQPDVQMLEEEWSESGMVAGIPVPEEFRSFVFKTVVSLRSADLEVTPDAIADSVARWLAPAEAERLRKALTEKEPD